MLEEFISWLIENNWPDEVENDDCRVRFDNVVFYYVQNSPKLRATLQRNYPNFNDTSINSIMSRQLRKELLHVIVERRQIVTG